MTTTTTSSYAIKLQEACNNASLYTKSHAVKSTSIFFQYWEDSDDGNRDPTKQWATLPHQLFSLVKHFEEDSHLAQTEYRSITLSSDPIEARRIALTVSILSNAPDNFATCFQRLFREILDFHIFNSQGSMKGEDSGVLYDDIEDDDDDKPASIMWEDRFDFDEERLYECIQTLKWLDVHNAAKTDILTRPLMQALYETITKRVSTKITGVFDQNDLHEKLQGWTKFKLLPILSKMSKVSDSDMMINTHFEDQIEHILAECYCTIRQSEIFDIVTDYPDSLPSIIDLKRVLQKTHTMNVLIATLKDTFRKRLHPGAQTNQILQVYMNTIKVLRIIDPTDCLLDHVSHDVKSYLRERGDTVRCIISSLTDEAALGGELYEELQRQDDVRPLEEAHYDSDEEEEMPGMDWNPTPSLYYQRTSGIGVEDDVSDKASEKAADLLSMLVSIYGSNDLFVDEYRLMLADKLLANVDFETDQEVHNLELLKIRFGESSMRQCEIMIKDMDDSKRIATNIHSTIRGKSEDEDDDNGPVVDAAIISHIFWPPLQKEAMKNHPRIQAKIDQFGLEYAKYKNPRRLVWFQQLGQVTLELDVYDDGEVVTKEFTCTPLQATLISHFEDNDGCWTAKDLANETGVSEDLIKKKMGMWINQHVVKVVSKVHGESCYELCSHQDATHAGEKDNVYDEEDDGLVVSMSGQEEEELSIYESYVIGMLSNLGSLPLERIHNTLKMFVTGSDHKYNKTPHQLSLFLQQLCKDEKIECGADGMYKLIKK